MRPITCSSSNAPQLFISRVVNSSSTITVEISSPSLGVLGTFSVPASTTANNVDYTFAPASGMPGMAGVITIGTLATILTLPSGDFQFTQANTALLMRVAVPSAIGVSYIAFVDAAGNTYLTTGLLTMQAESNLQFRVQGSGGSFTAYMDAGENLGLNKECAEQPVPITSINGVPPDPTGNFNLIPSTCVSITPAQYGLVVGNGCGKPCMGCSDVSTLTNRLMTVENELLAIRNYVNNMQALITQATNNINYQCSC